MKLGKLQYKKMSLDDIVFLATKNDYRALEELIQREQKNIFATFTYLNKKTDSVYDLTQEALMRMAKGIVNLKNPKTFRSWLNHIVMNLFYDNLRKINRIPPIISIDDDSEDYPERHITNPQNYIPDKKCKPMEKCISNELDRIIKHEMSQLPEHFRVPIVLRELQGLTYEEIAEVTKTNVGTVKSRISRARSRLQDGLKDYI